MNSNLITAIASAGMYNMEAFFYVKLQSYTSADKKLCWSIMQIRALSSLSLHPCGDAALFAD